MAKHDFEITPPFMNAAGSLGFSPDLHNALDWSRLGAFVTNPISLTPRTPAHGKRSVGFPGGFLLHTGYPNPGFSRAIRHYARHWQHSPIPVIVHLLAGSPDDLAGMTRRLEAVDGIAGLEVGVDSSISADKVVAITQAACGEYPVILRLPMERAVELAAAAVHAGATAVSLAPPRGIYPAGDREMLQGRLYGPAILPIAMKVVYELSQMHVPTIGAGGVYTQEHADAMLAAGAIAVQLDSALWHAAGHRLLT